MNFRKYSAQRSSILFTLLLIAAFAFWLNHIGEQSLWFDEGWSAYAAAQPSVIDAANADATNPPLYYVLLNLHAHILGDSERSLRLFSAFCGLLVVALGYRLAGQLFGRRTAIFAAAVIAFNPLMLWAAQEARMYTLLALLVLMCAAGFHTVVRRGTRYGWWLIWVGELGLLYAHNSGPVVVIWLNLAAITAWVAARNLSRPPWRRWLISQIAIGILWLPYFVTRFVQLTDANAAVASAPVITPGFLLDLWRALWDTPWERVALSSPSPISVVMLALWIVALASLFRRTALRWLICHTCLLSGALIAALIVLGNELHGRYLVMIAPLALIPLGVWLAGWSNLTVRWVGVASLVALLLGTVVANRGSDFRHDDARAMVQYYADTLTENDTVLAWSYADRYELAYYWDRLGVTARRVTLPEGQDRDLIAPLLPSSGSVALNIWFTQRADFRGMLSCLLADGTRSLPIEHTVHGMTNLLFRDPSLELPDLTDSDYVFGGSETPLARLIRHAEVTETSSDRAICLPLEIELLRPIDVDLKAALIVRNALGWEIARADAIFATANQRLTSQLEPGAYAAAYPLLRLPYGATSGVYDVYLRIYDEAVQPSGYEPERVGTVVGRDLLLGTWNASEVPDWESTDRLPEFAQIEPIPSGTRSLVGFEGNPAGRPLVNGEALRLELLWGGEGSLPELSLIDDRGDWSIAVSPIVDDRSDVVLDWRSAIIPPEAADGSAALTLPDGTVLATFEIQSLPLITDAPEFAESIDAEFADLGLIAGFTREGGITTDVPFELTIVWQAQQPSQSPYTVFVQLLDEQNRVLAQSDSQPAQGTRTTTGWRAGEYILDTHRMAWNDVQASPVGELRLIAGLYDPLTNQRLTTVDGADNILLEESIVLAP